MKGSKWFKHPRHGYMLRGPAESGWQTVVTALTLNAVNLQDDAALWKAYKSRLHVNGGCGAVAVDDMRVGDHNPEFAPIKATQVPEFLRQEFAQYL